MRLFQSLSAKNNYYTEIRATSCPKRIHCTTRSRQRQTLGEGDGELSAHPKNLNQSKSSPISWEKGREMADHQLISSSDNRLMKVVRLSLSPLPSVKEPRALFVSEEKVGITSTIKSLWPRSFQKTQVNFHPARNEKLSERIGSRSE